MGRLFIPEEGSSKKRPHSGRKRSKFGAPKGKTGGGSNTKSPAGGGGSNRRVFVGNLSYETSWQNLKDHMRKIGSVSHADILTGPDGRSKGCGIIEYGDGKDAQRAIRELHETELDGRTIFLREDKHESNGGGGGGSAAGGGKTVFVGNLSWDAKWHDLKDHMRKAGNVVHVEIMEKRDGRSKGCGVVTYEHPGEAARALKDLDGTTLLGRELFVQPDDRDGGRQPRHAPADPPPAARSRQHEDISLFVGNLSYRTSWQNLKDFMRKAGNVSRADIIKGRDGRSKGCGIVEFEHARDAERALRELNETELDGRKVYIQEDRGSDRNGDSGGGGGDGGGGSNSQLFVGNLAFVTSWQVLKDYFKQIADVDFAEVAAGNDGRSKGFGTIRYFKARDAEEAINRLDGTELDGRRLHVRLDRKA